MARKTQKDEAKAKAQKQKKILIGGTVVLVLLIAYQAPKMMKLMSGKRATPVTDSSVAAPPTTAGTTTTAAPATAAPTTPAPNTVAAPSLATTTPTTTTPSAGPQLVASVEPTADPGQLQQFYRFASKDPFAVQTPAPASRPSSSSKPSSSSSTTTTASSPPPVPPAAAPSSAVISLNGTLGSVTVGAAFPTSGPVFNQVGALFQLVSLTATSAKVTVVGGSYADGSQSLTLTVGKSVTLQNTADGTRYTLVLEPQGTQVPAAPVSGSSSSATPATTTPSATPSATPSVPSGSGG
jgi:hypothetical protein